MTKLWLPFLLLASATASAQTPPDFASYLKLAHKSIRTNLIESAKKMPEADYGFRPQGAAEEVRTFGELVAHLADTNYNFCSWAKGERRPGAAISTGRNKTMTKAELVTALDEALAYCDPVYTQATDATLLELVKQASPGMSDLTRASSLVGNLAHNNEHYGNIVTYLRAKGIVPPSTERAQQPRRGGGAGK
jgi:uncharacterized damage-inducible protein DinB